MTDDPDDLALERYYADRAAVDEITDLMHRLRSETLHGIARLEAALVVVIRDYFAPERGDEFAEWILDQMPLRRRLDLLRQILKRLDLWEAYGGTWRSISEVVEDRNRLAHSEVEYIGAVEPSSPDPGEPMFRVGGEDVDLDWLESIAARSDLAWVNVRTKIAPAIAEKTTPEPF